MSSSKETQTTKDDYIALLVADAMDDVSDISSTIDRNNQICDIESRFPKEIDRWIEEANRIINKQTYYASGRKVDNEFTM